MDAPSQQIIGSDPGWEECVRQIEFAATFSLFVVIVAASGSGKEILARMYHRASGREGEFVAVNCGAIPPELVASELFGHEKGAYSGASRSRGGRLKQADGGTLFLDEFTDLPTSAQVALLRALESGELQRVGSDTHAHSDVMVVAATNKDLRVEVEEGRLRPDFYYRLAGKIIELPPLNERCRADREEFGRLLLSPFVGMQWSAPALDAAIAMSYTIGGIREMGEVVREAAYKAYSQGRQVLQPADVQPSYLAPASVGLSLHEALSELGDGASLTQLSELMKVSRKTAQRRLKDAGYRHEGGRWVR